MTKGHNRNGHAHQARVWVLTTLLALASRGRGANGELQLITR